MSLIVPNRSIIVPGPSIQGLYAFDAIKWNADGSIKSKRRLAGWCENIVTDHGLNLKCGSAFSQITTAVGTGTSVPLATDTRLDEFLASVYSSNTAQGGVLGPPAYGWWRNIATFGVGVAAGNLTEVGAAIGSSMNANTDLTSRSLIKDSEGNPISITVLPDESLQVTTEFRLYSPPDDVVVQDVIAGVERTITIRASSAGSSGWQPMQSGNALANGSRIYYGDTTLGAVNQTPSSTEGGSNLAQGSQGNARTYVNNSYQRGYYMRRPTGSAQNIGGFNFETGLGHYQVKVDPPVAKSLTEVFTLDIMVSIGRP